MPTTLSRILMTIPVALCSNLALGADPLNLEFDQGVSSWRVVVDGVMGGRSTGRVTTSEPGILRFSGDLSLENNGGFSQVRTAVAQGSFESAQGIEMRVRGDGRSYLFDIRASNVRMMAGGFQSAFETTDGTWTTIRIPFDGFRLVSFGRTVPNPPALDLNRIESIGVTLADKGEGGFRLEIDSIKAYGGDTAPDSTSGNDLATVAKAAGLNTLLALIEAAQLELPTGEPITIFAPTDEAFAALPEATVVELLKPANRETLRTILKHHVSQSGLASAELLTRRSVSTLSGQRVGVDGSTQINIGNARVLAVDVPFGGGVVHVIDSVLMPELNSIGAIAAETESLSTLAAAVAAAGLSDQLGVENGPWTVFAPVNSAFDSLPSGTVEKLLQPENIAGLIEILGLHLVPGRIYANELLTAESTQSFFGNTINFELQGGEVTIDGARIVASDIEAANGVVHLIDRVILPAPSTETAAEASVSVQMRAQAAELCELAINRGAPLFNAGQPAGCAAVYEMAIESIVRLGSGSLDRGSVQVLEMALAEADIENNPTERAWIYRRAIDRVYTSFRAASPATTSPAATSIDRTASNR